LSRAFVVMWDRRRLLLFLNVSLVLATVGTLIGIYRIGYVPLFTAKAADMRLVYGDMVGPFAARFSGEFWVLPNLLASTLFVLEEGRRRRVSVSHGNLCTWHTTTLEGPALCWCFSLLD
jgi:hypothetical protein